MLFVGTYEHTIDAKQRLAIPSEIRDILKEAQHLYVTLIEGPTLAVYTEQGFERRAEELDKSERNAEEVLLYEQVFYSNAARLEVDKQGRIRVPDRLLQLTGLGKDVVIIGVKDHMEVHDRAHWNAKMQQIMSTRQDLLMNPRRVLKASQDVKPQVPAEHTRP